MNQIKQAFLIGSALAATRQSCKTDISPSPQEQLAKTITQQPKHVSFSQANKRFHQQGGVNYQDQINDLHTFFLSTDSTYTQAYLQTLPDTTTNADKKTALLILQIQKHALQNGYFFNYNHILFNNHTTELFMPLLDKIPIDLDTYPTLTFLFPEYAHTTQQIYIMSNNNQEEDTYDQKGMTFDDIALVSEGARDNRSVISNELLHTLVAKSQLAPNPQETLTIGQYTATNHERNEFLSNAVSIQEDIESVFSEDFLRSSVALIAEYEQLSEIPLYPPADYALCDAYAYNTFLKYASPDDKIHFLTIANIYQTNLKSVTHIASLDSLISYIAHDDMFVEKQKKAWLTVIADEKQAGAKDEILLQNIKTLLLEDLTGGFMVALKKYVTTPFLEGLTNDDKTAIKNSYLNQAQLVIHTRKQKKQQSPKTVPDSAKK